MTTSTMPCVVSLTFISLLKKPRVQVCFLTKFHVHTFSSFDAFEPLQFSKLIWHIEEVILLLPYHPSLKVSCCWTKHHKIFAKTRIIIIRISIVTRPVLYQLSGTTHHQHITKVSSLLFSVTSFFLETGFRVILTNLFHIFAFGQYWTETPACWQMTVDWTPCLKAWSGGGRTWRQALFLCIMKNPESWKTWKYVSLWVKTLTGTVTAVFCVQPKDPLVDRGFS